jgi:single-strand DNA-binding protein
MINKAIIIGNLGSDPEIRYTPSGTATAQFSVATTERYKDAEGNQKEIPKAAASRRRPSYSWPKPR